MRLPERVAGELGILAARGEAFELGGLVRELPLLVVRDGELLADFGLQRVVREALAVTHGNQVKASELLGVNWATLRKKSTPE